MQYLVGNQNAAYRTSDVGQYKTNRHTRVQGHSQRFFLFRGLTLILAIIIFITFRLLQYRSSFIWDGYL